MVVTAHHSAGALIGDHAGRIRQAAGTLGQALHISRTRNAVFIDIQLKIAGSAAIAMHQDEVIGSIL